MIARTIPEEEQLLTGIQPLTPLNIRHRIGPIAGGSYLEMKLLRQQIEGAVVGLPLAFVRHRDDQRRSAFAPGPATDIAPHQVTFVFEQDNQLSPLNLCPARCQFFLISSRRASTCASFRLGLPFSVR